jgi:high-affinity iron transporter
MPIETIIPSGRRRSRGALAALLVVCAVVASSLAGCGSSASMSIAVTKQACAPGWEPPRSGPMTFQVSNQTATTVDVQLLATGTQRVYAEIPTLGPGTTRPLGVTLGPGRYTWQCASVANSLDTSDPGLVTGPPVKSSPWYSPVNPDDLAAAADTYRDSVTAGLATLVSDTDALDHLVDADQIPAAKQQWLVAHLDYESLGAAYDTFGPFDSEIDGRSDGLAQGVADPKFTGFLRLEYGLWNNQSPAELSAVADQLDIFVHGLQSAWPNQLLIDTDLPLRTHEILENALHFEMTADTDEGSHTNLATVGANVAGTETTLTALAPLLTTRNPDLLASARSGLVALGRLVDTYDTATGWTPVQSLTTAQREQLDGAISALLEKLELVPGSLRLFTVGAD